MFQEVGEWWKNILPSIALVDIVAMLGELLDAIGGALGLLLAVHNLYR